MLCNTHWTRPNKIKSNQIKSMIIIIIITITIMIITKIIIIIIIIIIMIIMIIMIITVISGDQCLPAPASRGPGGGTQGES